MPHARGVALAVLSLLPTICFTIGARVLHIIGLCLRCVGVDVESPGGHFGRLLAASHVNTCFFTAASAMSRHLSISAMVMVGIVGAILHSTVADVGVCGLLSVHQSLVIRWQ